MASWPEKEPVASAFDMNGQLHVCIRNDSRMSSSGIFFGDNPLHHSLPVTIFQLFLVNLVSRALQGLLKPIGTPKYICNIMGGIFIGPSGLGRGMLKPYWLTLFPLPETDFISLMSIIGCSYFIFLVVLKMDILITVREGRKHIRLGILPILISMIVTFTLLQLFFTPELPNPDLVNISKTILSFTLSFTFFPCVSEALMDLNLMATELGQIALSSSVTSDIMQWTFGAILRILRANSLKLAIATLSSYVLFFLFAFFVVRPAMNWIARTTPVGQPVKEVYIVLILLGVLFMSGLCDAAGLSVLTGPLFLGLVVPSGPPLGTTLVEKTESLVSDFLLPFFFIYIGLNTFFHEIKDWRDFFTFQGILFAGQFTKFTVYFLISLTYNIKPKHGVVLGLLMNINGVTKLVAISRMKTLKLVDEQTFSHLVLNLVILTSVMSPMIKYLYKRHSRVNYQSKHAGRIKSIQSTPRNTEVRVLTCLHNEENVSGTIALLDALNPMPESPVCVYVMHLIELVGTSTPVLLAINYKQERKFLTINYPNSNHIMRAFEKYCEHSIGPITILPHINVSPYQTMHEAVCNLAQDKLVSFMIIPFHENGLVDVGGHVATSTRKVNINFLQNSPCTVGVLVDRYSRLGLNDPTVGFNVGVFFIGGADDREALALGLRISERPKTRVSLFRFVVAHKTKVAVTNGRVLDREEGDTVMDSVMDEGLVDEFKSKKYGNGNVTWSEFLVEDITEVLEVIRSVEGNFDLVIVGRTHNIQSMQDEEMVNFIENAEMLGIVGDMLASTEFCIGMVPVLVTQCGGKTKHMDRLSSNNSSR